MPGPIQSGISGILTTAAGAVVAGKHLANEEEARLADLEQLRADTAQELATEENTIRRETVAMNKPNESDVTMRAYDLWENDNKNSFGKKTKYAGTTADRYVQRALEELESEAYTKANKRVEMMYYDPARALQRDFVEGKGDAIFKSRQQYLSKLAKKRREVATSRRYIEKGVYQAMADNPHAMSDEDEADAQEYFRQQDEKEANE